MASVTPQPFDFLHNIYPYRVSSPAATVPYFFSLPTVTSLGAFLHTPHNFYIEIGPRERLEAILMDVAANRPDFFLSVTTPVAYNDQIAAIIAHALGDRFGMKDVRNNHLRTCLQEALTNAVIHGNLEMKHSPSTWREFEHFYAVVQATMAMEPYRSRRVHMYAWNHDDLLQIAVRDEGHGFSEPEAPEEMVHNASFSNGRGLYLIRALAKNVWIGGDKKTLFMTFAY